MEKFWESYAAQYPSFMDFLMDVVLDNIDWDSFSTRMKQLAPILGLNQERTMMKARLVL